MLREAGEVSEDNPASVGFAHVNVERLRKETLNGLNLVGFGKLDS